MLLTWKVGTTSLSTTSRFSWIQKHLSVRLHRPGFENSRNSCPTSQIPGFGRLFSIHTTSVPDVTAQLLVWEQRGRAVAQGKPKAGAADPWCSPSPALLCPWQCQQHPLPRPGQDGTEQGKSTGTVPESQLCSLGPDPQPEGALRRVTLQSARLKQFHRYCRTTQISYSVAPRGQHHLELLRNPKSTWEQWETILQHKAKLFHSEPLQTGLFCHRNVTQRSKKAQVIVPSFSAVALPPPVRWGLV